jgi:serine-type D-Ala-D-Ala carboxypeptidase (penicillin-binding protein 5/6)
VKPLDARTRRLASAIGVAALLLGATPPVGRASEHSEDRGPPHVDARAWVVMDADTGETLASESPSRELPIASTTKLMTAYLTLQRLALAERVPMARYSVTVAGESLLGVAAGAPISMATCSMG